MAWTLKLKSISSGVVLVKEAHISVRETNRDLPWVTSMDPYLLHTDLKYRLLSVSGLQWCHNAGEGLMHTVFFVGSFRTMLGSMASILDRSARNNALVLTPGTHNLMSDRLATEKQNRGNNYTHTQTHTYIYSTYTISYVY